MKIDIFDSEESGMYYAQFPFADAGGNLHLAESEGMTPGECLRNLAEAVDKILDKDTLHPQGIPHA